MDQYTGYTLVYGCAGILFLVVLVLLAISVRTDTSSHNYCQANNKYFYNWGPNALRPNLGGLSYGGYPYGRYLYGPYGPYGPPRPPEPSGRRGPYGGKRYPFWRGGRAFPFAY